MRDQIIICSDDYFDSDLIEKIKGCFAGAAINQLEQQNSYDSKTLERSRTLYVDFGKQPSDAVLLISQQMMSDEFVKKMRTHFNGTKILMLEDCEIVCVTHTDPAMNKPKIKVEAFGYPAFTERIRQHFINFGIKTI